MRSNQRRSALARSLAVRAAHAGRAAAAAEIARRHSAAPMFGMSPSFSAVAGLCTVMVPPPSAGDQAPSMKHNSRSKRGSLSFMDNLTYIPMQKFQAALQSELRARGVETGAIGAVETVTRRV